MGNSIRQISSDLLLEVMLNKGVNLVVLHDYVLERVADITLRGGVGLRERGAKGYELLRIRPPQDTNCLGYGLIWLKALLALYRRQYRRTSRP